MSAWPRACAVISLYVMLATCVYVPLRQRAAFRKQHSHGADSFRLVFIDGRLAIVEPI